MSSWYSVDPETLRLSGILFTYTFPVDALTDIRFWSVAVAVNTKAQFPSSGVGVNSADEDVPRPAGAAHAPETVFADHEYEYGGMPPDTEAESKRF